MRKAMTKYKDDGNGQLVKEIKDNGKDAPPEVLVHAISNNIQAQQALTHIKNSIRGNIAEEKTKFSVAEGLHNDEKIHHFTQFRNFDEVKQVNKLEMYNTLLPMVFGDSKGVKTIIEVIQSHVKTHKTNMRSYQRLGEKAIVDILRADSGELPNVSGWKKFTGIGR